MNQFPQQPNAFSAFRALNPDQNAPRPQPSISTQVTRVSLAGSLIEQYMMPESFVPLERVYRVLPNEGVFAAKPNMPAQLELGSFTVPQQMMFFLLDYRFEIYRPSGATLGDFLPLEDRRLSTFVGWTTEALGKQQGNFAYQLIPSPPTVGKTEFEASPNPGFIPGTIPPLAANEAFERARFVTNQSFASGALSTQPQRHHREGLMQAQYCWVLRASQRFTMKALIFNAVPIPIAFFEGGMTGILTSQNAGEQIIAAAAPPALPPGGY